MKPSALLTHLKSKHPTHENDTKAMMIQKKARFEASGTLMKHGFAAPKKPVLEAAYKVAYRIAKDKKPHTIGETLVKPCALDMVESVCGREQRLMIEKIPLSNDSVRRTSLPK